MKLYWVLLALLASASMAYAQPAKSACVLYGELEEVLHLRGLTADDIRRIVYRISDQGKYDRDQKVREASAVLRRGLISKDWG